VVGIVRVKILAEGLKAVAEELGIEGWREFRTPDRTRIDFAFTKGAQRLLAVEFERSRKWLFARVLYNAVKAQRAEFPVILFVYPFYDLPRAGRSWVPNYVEDTLGLRLGLCHPRDCESAVRALLAEQLGQPSSCAVSETDRVITKVTDAPTGAPPSLTVGAEAWRQAAQKRTSPKRSTRKRSTARRKSSRSKS
jgi:hypothetical protein